MTRAETAPAALELRFADGTLEIRGALEIVAALPGDVRYDPRAGCHRAPAYNYQAIAMHLHRACIAWDDRARRWEPLPLALLASPPPRPYQSAALAAWRGADRRGVVVLPTGAGKSHVATMAIAEVRRPTLIVAPTLDLVRQWQGLLGKAFGTTVGVVGGGSHEVLPLTVTTYDSAWAQMPFLGNRFGMLVFDEVHHLPGESYAHAALLAMAPFRLGLTATPERSDGADSRYADLVGPIAFRSEITEMSGLWLADYDVERVEVPLDDDERAAWGDARETFRAFCRDAGVRLSDPDGFRTFLRLSGRSAAGREALRAWRQQRRIAQGSRAKLRVVGALLQRFASDPTILFTDDNATALTLARALLIPIITHQTRVAERAAILAGLASRRYGAVVTSRVLNEGVDVPEAAVAIVVSGSGSVREHVQRLGRVLRKVPGKRALLIELVSADTGEGFTSARRREHAAYR